MNTPNRKSAFLLEQTLGCKKTLLHCVQAFKTHVTHCRLEYARIRLSVCHLEAMSLHTMYLNLLDLK